MIKQKFFWNLPALKLFRAIGRPQVMPVSLTLSSTYNCNSRCKTCNIRNKKVNEMLLEEWEKISERLNGNIFWITISGGEPFLRKDLSDIVHCFYIHAHPSIITIPTNGLLPDIICHTVDRIAANCKTARIVINLSVDDVGERHDFIRGVQGNYEKVVETYRKLRKLNHSNLSIGIHTVISRYNVADMRQIQETVHTLAPDSYIAEIAEEREELGTIGADIAPDCDTYSDAVTYMINKAETGNFDKTGRIARAFRIEYHRIVKKMLRERRQIIPCFAGFASGQISPDGEVWMCCTRAESAGNLRDADYVFQKVWFSEKANALRKNIKAGTCFCPLANAAYTNMLMQPACLARVSWNFIKHKL